MKILISGICGFVARCLAERLQDLDPQIELVGIDNFSRAGSELNVEPLRARGVQVVRGDIRSVADVEALPPADWIIDAAANASVLAGVDGATSSRELLEINLYGTVNLLEFAKRVHAGFILLSTSRVYSLKKLASLPMRAEDGGWHLQPSAALPEGVTARGVSERFSTEPPLSLYGVSKLASELLALEYGETFDLPVWINRCGVLAGAGQFGRPDQGIFAFWINSYLRRMPLRYLGFDGTGYQTRDCLHPRDLAPLLLQQMSFRGNEKPRVINLGGGSGNAMSLAQLSGWCADRFGVHAVASDSRPRRFDVPWLVMDSALARETWDWQPATNLGQILEEIATHAEAHPQWLQVSGAA